MSIHNAPLSANNGPLYAHYAPPWTCNWPLHAYGDACASAVALSSIDKSQLHIDIEPCAIGNGALSANNGALSAGNAAMSVNGGALSAIRGSLRAGSDQMLVSNDVMSAGISAPSAASVD
jgi:hypothetical protein